MMVCFALAEEVEDGIAVQRNEPANLQVVGGDSLLGQLGAGFVEYALRSSPSRSG